MRKLLAIALFLALTAPAHAARVCLKLTRDVKIEIDVLVKRSGQSETDITYLLNQFACQGISSARAFETVSGAIRTMKSLRDNTPQGTALREDMMAGLRGRDRAAMEQYFADLSRMANDNDISGFINLSKDKADDVYRANLERDDPSGPQYIASEKEQAKACTPERIAASAERAKDCAK
jgi:hypothetical protein